MRKTHEVCKLVFVLDCLSLTYSGTVNCDSSLKEPIDAFIKIIPQESYSKKFYVGL